MTKTNIRCGAISTQLVSAYRIAHLVSYLRVVPASILHYKCTPSRKNSFNSTSRTTDISLIDEVEWWRPLDCLYGHYNGFRLYYKISRQLPDTLYQCERSKLSYWTQYKLIIYDSSPFRLYFCLFLQDIVSVCISSASSRFPNTPKASKRPGTDPTAKRTTKQWPY